MAKNKLKTGQKVEKSGIYGTDKKKTPEIALTKGDRVPPIGGQSAKVQLKRAVKKSKGK